MALRDTLIEQLRTMREADAVELLAAEYGSEFVAFLSKHQATLGEALVEVRKGGHVDEPLAVEIAQLAARANARAPDAEGEPPCDPRREVKKSKRLEDGSWLRYELVPCGNSRCRKDPDHHGPYWYHHKRHGGRWRMRYLGNDLARLPPPVAVGEAERIVAQLAALDALDDGAVQRLRDVVSAFAGTSDPRNVELRNEAGSLLNAELRRRDEEVRRLHQRLLKKAESGGGLTAAEQRQLDDAVAHLRG